MAVTKKPDYAGELFPDDAGPTHMARIRNGHLVWVSVASVASSGAQASPSEVAIIEARVAALESHIESDSDIELSTSGW